MSPVERSAGGGGGGGGGGGAWTLITSAKLNATAANIDIQNISGAFNHLVFIFMGRSTQAVANVNMLLTFNGDSGANYDRQDFGAFGTTVSAAPAVAQTSAFLGNVTGSTDTANSFGMAHVFISFYANTGTYKIGRSDWQTHDTLGTGTTYTIASESILWRSTAAITRMTLTPSGGLWDVNTAYTLHGIT